MSGLAELAQRKSLLAAKSELQRLQIAHAWREIRTTVAPAPSPERALWARPKVAKFLTVALPLVGARRLGRMVRFLSIGLIAFRAIRYWRA